MKKESQQTQSTGIPALQLIKNIKDNLSNLTPIQLAQQLEQLEIAVGHLEQLKAKLNQQTQSGSGGQASADDQNSQTGAHKNIVPGYGDE